KQLRYSTDEASYIRLFAKPNAPLLGKRLGEEFGRFRKLIEGLDSTQLDTLQETGSLVIEGERFDAEDILVFREAREGTDALSNHFVSIDPDSSLAGDLMREVLAREVDSCIQKAREDLGLNASDRIVVLRRAAAERARAIEEHLDYVRGETLAVGLKALPE